jgi:hypothetical protein
MTCNGIHNGRSHIWHFFHWKGKIRKGGRCRNHAFAGTVIRSALPRKSCTLWDVIVRRVIGEHIPRRFIWIASYDWILRYAIGELRWLPQVNRLPSLRRQTTVALSRRSFGDSVLFRMLPDDDLWRRHSPMLPCTAPSNVADAR